MAITELPRTAWRKSSYSGNGGGNCVEVAATQTLHLARDSKNPNGPVLAFTQTEWATFLAGVKAGNHDL